MSNKIKVLFFATLRDKAGTRSVDLEIPQNITIADLKKILIEKYPGLNYQGMMEHCLASINHDYKFDETIIPANAEVAIFPPVSGG
jgi:molybdopterin converting factor subunit 1